MENFQVVSSDRGASPLKDVYSITLMYQLKRKYHLKQAICLYDNR